MSKTITIGKQGQQRMALTDSSISRKHCSITLNDNNTLTLKDEGSTNGTYVNDIQIIQTTVQPDTIIRLGPSFRVKVADLLPPDFIPAPTFSLRPLKPVWEEYNERKNEIMTRNAKRANLQRLQGLFSSAAMCIGFIDAVPLAFRGLLMAIAFILGVVFFVLGQKTANSLPLQLEELQNEYSRKYVCPNPNCRRPFQLIPYLNIEFTPGCPSCRCKYTH